MENDVGPVYLVRRADSKWRTEREDAVTWHGSRMRSNSFPLRFTNDARNNEIVERDTISRIFDRKNKKRKKTTTETDEN